MLGFRVVKRQEPLGWGSFFIFLVAIAFSFAVSGGLLVIQGKPMVEGIVLLAQGGFGSSFALEDTLLKTIPIFLCSLGVAVSFRMQVWNIGAEGQFALGAIGATWAVATFPDLPMYAMIPAMLCSAMVAGAMWGFIPAVLRLKFGMNEIISTLMLNYIGIFFLQYLVFGAWKDPSSFGFPMTPVFPDTAIFPYLFGRIHWGIVLCIVVAVALAIFLRRTRLGFEITAGGENPQAARCARMPYGLLVLFVMCMCGALAGLAGAIETSSTLNRLQPSIMVGYGYTAIVVAWLSRLKVSSIALYAFLLAGLRVGVENLQLDLGVPAAFGDILEGLILLSVLAGQFFDLYGLERHKGEKA
ncbi:MAG: ABC transporter permease [Pseudomonadota bacterium]